MSKARAIVQQLIGFSKEPVLEKAQAFAPVNIALCKYWGKRDEDLNLPVTSSLSISLTEGTTTEVCLCQKQDLIILNNLIVAHDHPFYIQVKKFLDILRPNQDHFYKIKTHNDLPTASGLASSASGFAALALALNQLYGWNLNQKNLSIIARLGSGSASRSIYQGFVEWHAGSREDGLDSFSEPISELWHGLCIGVVITAKETKPISSRTAMRLTKENSILYKSWPKQVEHDLPLIKKAIREKHFSTLGATAESNALCMHATMLSCFPSICYWNPQSLEIMHLVWKLRKEGIPVYFTMDAGPNVKLLFEKQNIDLIHHHFSCDYINHCFAIATS